MGKPCDHRFTVDKDTTLSVMNLVVAHNVNTIKRIINGKSKRKKDSADKR